jgi:broad specificity phosphatase PhoE
MSKSGRASPPPETPESQDPTSPNPSRFVFARHGESTWNLERRIQGQLDPPLSASGQAQARCLADRLAGRRWAGFYSSDLRRALDTAHAIAGCVGMQPVPLRELREVRLGEWEGLQREELIARYPEAWEAWTRAPSWDIVPGSEGAAAFERRVAGVLADLGTRHPEGDVLIVTHGGVIQVALLQVVGKGSNGAFPFHIQNASLSALERRSSGTVIASVNDTCHLESLRD